MDDTEVSMIVRKTPSLGFTSVEAKPEWVDPPNCACRGNAPQMREHTRHWCSTITTDELNEVFRDRRATPIR